VRSWLQRLVASAGTFFAVLTSLDTDLKSLILHRVKDRCSGPLSLPFQLDKLDLVLNVGSSSNLLHALSRQSSITSLSIRARIDHLKQLLPLAPHLLALEVNQWGSDTAQIAHFVSKCTQLKHLHLTSDNLDCVDSVATSLETLKIELFDKVHVVPILDLLNSETVALKALERLTVHSVDGYYEPWRDREAREGEWEGWSDVEEFCRQKKIGLVVTESDEED
jgi:hypothetical protein